jgi:hypothetical protein
MRMRVDFDRTFWCSSYLMFPCAAAAARPPAPVAATPGGVSLLVLLISLVLISVGIRVPTTTG